MRHSSTLDRLGRENRKKVRRLLGGVIAIYFSLAALVVGGTMIRAWVADSSTGIGISERVRAWINHAGG